MATYNLTVQLTAQANSLISGLRSAADAARDLGRRTRELDRRLAALDASSRRTARQVDLLGARAQATAARLGALGTRGGQTGDRLRRAGSDAGVLERSLKGAGRQAGALSRLLAGGALFLGTGQLVEEGNRYQRQMNIFQAVTSATAGQMQRAAWMANQLGNDLTLPTTTAADAAEAMVELAKAGFRTDQAISATRASLQLASAAGVNAADSARYLGDIMDQFGLGADQAARASDILAATANNASGGIIDIYYAMRYAGPVAAGLGVSMEDAASAVGMLGKAGILGQTAGTALRGMMANLAAPTKDMRRGLKALGIEAWDAQGRFKGLRYVIEELSRAQHEMSQQDFTAAVKRAMGKPAMSGAIALAHQGTESFDALNLAVRETGAAAQITAARGQGLAGAMTLLRKQTRQTGLALYDAMAPGLEYVTRLMTQGLSSATPYLVTAIEYGHDLATLYGPELRQRAHQGLGGLIDEAEQLLGPLKALGEEALADGLHLLINVGKALMTVLDNLADGLSPIGRALADVSDESDGAANSLDIVVMVLDAAASAVAYLSGVLVPIGSIIGNLVSGFGSLPGPVQTAILAMLLARRVSPVMSNLASTVRGRVTGAFQSLNQQMALQRALATASGQSVTRYGAAFAVLQTRVPVIGAMTASFRSASTAGSGFRGTLSGITRAAGTGLTGAMRGLVGVMGGPWGLALTGVAVGLGLLADRQQKAAERAAAHEQRISDLTEALLASNGAIDANVRAQAAQFLMDTKTADGGQRLVDVMKNAGVSLSELTDAYLGQGQTLDGLQGRLQAVADAHDDVWQTNEFGDTWQGYDVLGRRAQDAADALDGVKGEMDESVQRAKDLAEAQRGTGQGVTAYDKLKAAVGALADRTADADTRTRALKDALDLLSGGSISLQAAEARVNSAILNVNEALDDGIDKADGYGKALLNNNGTLNTTTRNGQQLYQSLTSLSDAAADAAVSAYALAQQNGTSLPESLAAAREQMDKARAAAVKAAQGYGLLPEQAEAVADSLGLLPSKVSLLLETEGMDSTLADLLAVQAEFDRFPKQSTIRVDSLSEQAQKDLEELGFTIETVAGTRQIKITAPTKSARDALKALIDQLGQTPDRKTVKVNAATVGAIASLRTVEAELIKSPDAKTITVSAPTAEARQALEDLGFKVTNMPKGKAEITVPVQPPLSALGTIQGAIDSLRGKTVTITTRRVEQYLVSPTGETRNLNRRTPGSYADGAVVSYYVVGGVRENHVAQIAPAGSWRVWAEPETQGEAYVPLAASKRPRSKTIVEEVVRRFGGDVTWYADGGLSGWAYAPSGGRSELVSVSSIRSDSMRTVKRKGKEVEVFDLGRFEKNLDKAMRRTERWRKDLRTVARRAGQDVADALEAMGEDGIELTHKMATGSSKYLKEMASDLQRLGLVAKTTLGDFTAQLRQTVKDQSTFEQNLAKLASLGYGDLAARLAEQGDEAAEKLAAEAVKNPKRARQANDVARAAAKTLAAEDLTDLLTIISAVRTSTTGIHKVADTTGLEEDRIIEVGNLGQSRIRSALGARATMFLSDLAKANKGLAYANGGIWEPGVYSSPTALIKFAEASTGGEAFIPLAPAKRAAATTVLADVAQRFGLQLAAPPAAPSPVHTVDARPAGPVQVVVVRERQPLIGTMPVTVTSTQATPQQIGAEVMRRLRNAQRGGRL
ncbi:phage tail tape measure protein [Streptomyces sp. HNM0663]|uniref:Phage tail tape measure protein n=1 Tax=Streptomyces chengmaiensis TaxID=3040919 RepID=A0ABT6HKZ1_9ACTN|nr:phage tail tape measure protein [Streptomyces chengmaiensis]MDH2389397.1 phage tail tape measure protein [Streptomyces chengmaiensis]